MNKYISTTMVAVLLISALPLIAAVPAQAQGPGNQSPGNDTGGTGDMVNDTKGQYGESGFGPGPQGIGERIKGIVGDKVQQIKEKVQSGNFTGKEIAEIAKQTGVRVKDVVMTKVQEIQNQTQQRIQKMKKQRQRTQAHVKEAKASRYDYAYDKFTEEAHAMVKEAKERGIDTEGLKETLDNVSIQYMKMHQSENPEKYAEKMKSLADQFRNKLQEKAGEQTQKIKEQARERIQDQEKAMNKLKNQTWGNMKNRALTVLENRIKSAENRINAVEKNFDVNTTELENKLQEIKDMKPEIEQAYETQNKTEIQEVTNELRTLWEEFRELYRETHREKIMQKTMGRLEDTLNKTEQLMDTAEEKGISTAEAKASQEGIENGLQKAKQAMQNQNFGTAQEKIQEMKQQFSQYRNQIQELAGQVKAQEGE